MRVISGVEREEEKFGMTYIISIADPPLGRTSEHERLFNKNEYHLLKLIPSRRTAQDMLQYGRQEAHDTATKTTEGNGEKTIR